MMQKARAALRRCLVSHSTHRLITELRQEDINFEAGVYLDGTPADDLPLLQAYKANMLLSFSVERLVEGLHSFVHKLWAHAPRHSLAYDSVHLRLAEIKQVVAEPSGLKELAAFLQGHRNPKRCLAALGLESHPSAQWAKSPWDPIYAKIVYHADALSVQRAPPSSVQVAPPGDPLVDTCGASSGAGAAMDAAALPWGEDCEEVPLGYIFARARFPNRQNVCLAACL